ncbi:MAG: hypothetical protein HXS46_15530 [Theionarchaea archaeon]|nr:MAG: hypothetical protein AYK18_12165 [Theionarchaea archaeon DG-70]MBU7012095.1 hypothetical protein [Theionarchaea archaeon]
MGYRALYIWVEGDKDFRFFDSIMKPIFENKYDYVKIIKYGETKKEKINSYLESIILMGSDYIFVGDINTYSDEKHKKQELKHKYKKVDENRIIVVKREIESWYLAGLDLKSSKILQIPYLNNTDEIVKEQFNSMMPRKFDSEIDFMIEILKHYSIDIAKQKNESFRNFIDEYDC